MIHKRFSTIRVAALMMTALSLLGTTIVRAAPLTHDTAPSLSDAELGHLRNIVSLAQQDLDDWTGFEGRDQKGMEAYRYQIAFMTYALTLQQYNSVPAYRDLYEDTIDRLIARMLEKPVWDFWEEVSQSSRSFDPDYDGPRPAKRDPVGEKNIMYSGHVVHMIALYEMLYRDMKWSAENALSFRWSSDESYDYSYADLVDIINREMLAPRLKNGKDSGAMECEPNLVFPECNQHPTLAFMLFDRLRETDYGSRTKKALKGFFDDTAMNNPETAHTAAYYMVKQDKTLRIPMVNSASADGWTGAFMHAWDPEYINSLYEAQRDSYVLTNSKTGEIRLAPDPSKALGLAFFANYAVEVGDTATAEKLFDYAGTHYKSRSDENGFRYVPTTDKAYPVNNTTDKILAMARSNRPNGLWKMHNEPFEAEAFNHPLLAHVDFPRVLVRQAVWDDESEALLFVLEPANGSLTTIFRIENLPTNYLAGLYQNDTWIAAIDEHAQVAGANTRNLAPGEIEIRVTLDGPTRFTLKPIE